MLRSIVSLGLAFAAATACAGPIPSAAAAEGGTATAIFAGGCFWCTESDFEKLPGVIGAVSGYTGGRVAKPTYKQVAGGGTGHIEAVRVAYDPRRVSYAQLVDYHLRHIDPTDGGGQFCDRGDQYRAAIFPATEAERRIATAAIARLDASGRLPAKVATLVAPAKPFYPAEAYHQDYYKKNSVKYRFYRWNCGRDARVAAVWGGKRAAR